MIRFSLALAIALVTTVNSIASLASADQSRLPINSYPSGTHIITYYPTVSNTTMDCQWGFFCEGNVPLFHFRSEDRLQRTRGWAQYAVWQHARQRIQFVVYSSQYLATVDSNGRTCSLAAFNDFHTAIIAQGYRPLGNKLHLLPLEVVGSAFVALQRSGSIDLVAMAAWIGSHEVEALTVFSHRSRVARREAVTYLARQLSAAIRDTSPA